jgi:hypothetical protein
MWDTRANPMTCYATYLHTRKYNIHGLVLIDTDHKSSWIYNCHTTALRLQKTRYHIYKQIYTTMIINSNTFSNVPIAE